MLGSLNEAEDAVQEAWLRLNRADSSEVHNLTGWLTTVVSRVCLDVLRARKSRREDSLDESVAASPPHSHAVPDPEQDAVLADSVGIALLVVLDTLTPAERLAFVLHDMFDVPFDEIASIIGRSPDAARQIASRARRRVRGMDTVPDANLPSQRKVVDAFLAALRARDLEGLLAVLDPDVALHTDIRTASGAPIEIRGARQWAQRAIAFGWMARSVQPALINGSVGLVLAAGGRISRAVIFKIDQEKIVETEVIADRARLDELDLAVLSD